MPSTLRRSIRALVVEDEEGDFIRVRTLLGRPTTLNHYQLDWAPTYEAGIEALLKRPYDVALADHRLGARTGLDWLRAVGAGGNPMPIIILTGADSPEVDREAAASGAADYLCKVDLDTTRLERSIRYALGRAEARTELRRTTASLEKRLLSIGDEERRRIGADLHDDLGQHLTGIACLAAALRDQLKSVLPEQAEKARHIAGLVNGAIELTRMLARGLCPVQIEQGGLHAALADLAFRVQRLHGVACWFENGGPPPALEPSVALHLYRIAQEAVNNAVRHGAADQIAMKLEVGGTPSRLIIDDNGRGFDFRANRAGRGLGLQLMERRADLIGGSFKVIPRSRGTRVECTFARPPVLADEG